ncbi:hypothetical protein OROHE_015897 [Orobanche hederae]
MGKGEDDQNLPSTALDAQSTTPGAGNSNGCCSGCSRFQKLVNFRCVFVLVLGFAVLFSAVFWLPFFQIGHHKDLDLDYGGHDIVASFMLRRPASFIQDNILQLEGDIFDEMSFSSTKVKIISLESSATPNITKVVFAIESDATTKSLIRANFVSLITHQSFLRLTESFFGDPFEFDVLKFRGGITVSPEQKAFLMQNVQIIFNFTLNFSIGEILVNFEELRSQLNAGLHLAPYENLYIRLTNLKGSTVAPPTTVQSQVLLAVGINPSKWRLKQLAQTITGSHTKNLGLNNTVFGRVKQVSLSSIVQPSPSPSPSPSSLSPSHHHHHHRHHKSIPAPNISPSPSTGHNHGSAFGRGSPASAPVPVPVPGKRNAPPPPPGCHFGPNNPWKHNSHSHVAPSYPPDYAPSPTPTPTPLQPKPKHLPSPIRPPFHAASPPNAVRGHSHPPSRARPLNVTPIVSSPSPSPSSAVILSSNIRSLLLFVLVILLL